MGALSRLLPFLLLLCLAAPFAASEPEANQDREPPPPQEQQKQPAVQGPEFAGAEVRRRLGPVEWPPDSWSGSSSDDCGDVPAGCPPLCRGSTWSASSHTLPLSALVHLPSRLGDPKSLLWPSRECAPAGSPARGQARPTLAWNKEAHTCCCSPFPAEASLGLPRAGAWRAWLLSQRKRNAAAAAAQAVRVARG